MDCVQIYSSVILVVHLRSNFGGTLFSETCRILGIEKTRTTTMKPQSDGFVKRLHQTLCNILNYTIYENPLAWDEVIRLCTLAYNSSIQESTGQTPNFMVYGWEATLPIDLASPTENTEVLTKMFQSMSKKGEDMPWCIPCHCPDTVKHILLDCIDLRDTRIKYYRNINSMKNLFNENIFNFINYLKEVGLFKKF